MGFVDPIPGILFRTAAIAGPAGAAGIYLLARWAEERKAERRTARRAKLMVAILLFGLVGAGVALGTYEIVEWQETLNRVSIAYRAFLQPNGTGEARVTLPMPSDEGFLSHLQVTPESSTIAANRSGDEPALDVLLTEPTWVNASFSAVRGEHEPWEVNVTRTAELCQACPAQLSMQVVSGAIHDVRIRLRAYRAVVCQGSHFEIDAVVLPGVNEYPGGRATWVC